MTLVVAGVFLYSPVFATPDTNDDLLLDKDASEEELEKARQEYKELKERKDLASNDLEKAIQRYEKEGGPIQFERGSSKISKDSFIILDEVAKVIKNYPRLHIRIEGHTDSRGDDISNLILSEKRANAVKEYLVSKKKIQANRITSIGFGESKPMANNKTWTGRLINRRVEFHFYIP